MEMTQMPLLYLRSTPVHKFTALSIQETELENKRSWKINVSNLLSHWKQTVVTLTFPDLRIPGIADVVLQQVLSQASTASVRRPPLRLTAFSPAGGPRFPRFPFPRVTRFALSLTVQDATLCSRECLLFECGHPCDTLSCLFFTRRIS